MKILPIVKLHQVPRLLSAEAFPTFSRNVLLLLEPKGQKGSQDLLAKYEY